jgi:fructose-bisphosphate aldolase class 1
MNKQTTTLWSLIETMQRALEDQGLDADTVDAAVKRRLARTLGRVSKQSALPCALAVPAQA